MRPGFAHCAVDFPSLAASLVARLRACSCVSHRPTASGIALAAVAFLDCAVVCTHTLCHGVTQKKRPRPRGSSTRHERPHWQWLRIKGRRPHTNSPATSLPQHCCVPRVFCYHICRTPNFNSTLQFPAASWRQRWTILWGMLAFAVYGARFELLLPDPLDCMGALGLRGARYLLLHPVLSPMLPCPSSCLPARTRHAVIVLLNLIHVHPNVRSPPACTRKTSHFSFSFMFISQCTTCTRKKCECVLLIVRFFYFVAYACFADGDICASLSRRSHHILFLACIICIGTFTSKAQWV